MEVARQRHTFREYLDLEAISPIKHEFFGGHVWAMAGGSPDHARFAVNISTALANQLRGRPCAVFSSDLRIRVQATGLATYPDVSVICGELECASQDPGGNTVTNPVVIIEVLSPSTEDYDRGEKLAHYKLIPSLRDIVFVAHDERRLELWRRVDADRWTLEVVRDRGAATLASIACTLDVAAVFHDPLSG
ncbi:Uma2 family endonuclease [Enhygromyxa salina]|uniref:Putative restriction endonuclease domain-containing protein n=1 Tax=Enhygromyxa salina TaxID=215803 RepID=A0A2S9YYV5_9BACT|nr:Uma2 family endonuclease [Enhygromyxa salina]PRQ10257.1 hypothetical protein ENSA7_00660 [Enhygromyxa salina]